MPTLMTPSTFDDLCKVRMVIADKMVEPDEPSSVFIPWAGNQLLSSRQGLYYVGIAIAAEEAYGFQTFDARLKATEGFCIQPSRGYAPYWRFLNRLSKDLLGGPYDQTQNRWGWSNLLKIAGNRGAPSTWPHVLVNGQFEACKIAFKEEIDGLRNSLIVITSANEYGILYGVTSDVINWNREKRKGETYWLHHHETGNIFVHTHHPNYMSRRGIFDAAANEVVGLARATGLSWLAQA